MKGIVFTMDAIFALIIASAAISIMLYFQFVPQTSYAIQPADAQNLLDVLLATNVSSMSGSSAIVYAMQNQQHGALFGWDSLRGGTSNQGNSPYGPLSPFISYTISVANSVTTGIVADYGNIYFASGNVLYAFTKYGAPLWTNSSTSVIMSTPVLYGGRVIYWTSNRLVDLNAYTGGVVWTTNALPSTSASAPIIAYDGEIILGASNGNMYVLYANNGMIMSTNTLLGGAAKSITVSDGSIATVSNTVQLLTNDQGVSSQGGIWSDSLSGTTSGIAGEGNVLATSAGDIAYLLHLNGTTFASVNTGSQVYGLAAGNGYTIYQSTDAVTALLPSGTIAWSKAITSSVYGTPVLGTSPVIAQGHVYSLWSNGYLIAQNISSGAVSWTSKIPYPNLDANMTVAYGRLYVIAGNTIVAYGSCNQNAGTSMLQAAVSLYLNGDGSCADYLLNNVASMGNYTLEIGSNIISTSNIATFSGANSYIITGGNYSTLYTMSISFWAYPHEGGNQQNMVDSSPRYLAIGISASNDITLNPGTSTTVTTSNAIPINSWTLVTVTAQTSGPDTIYTLYLNGTKAATGIVAQNIQMFKTMSFGSYQASYAYNGLLANVQFYSSVLSPQQVGALYQEGISGSPLNNAGLLSWYPLDGDANDYGGQANDGYNINVAYTPSNYMPRGLLNAYDIGKSSVLVSVYNYSTGAQKLYNVGVITWG